MIIVVGKSKPTDNGHDRLHNENQTGERAGERNGEKSIKNERVTEAHFVYTGIAMRIHIKPTKCALRIAWYSYSHTNVCVHIYAQ